MADPRPMNFEQEPRIVDEVAVLDLDRTLLNTSAVTQLMLASMARHGVGEDRINQAIEYVEAQKGNSFHLFDYIEHEFSVTTLEAIVEEIMQDDALTLALKDDLLCPGADKLVYALEDQGTPAMILTFGEHNYQSFKIDLFRKLIHKTNKELPGIVTDTANKSMWVKENWFNRTDELGEVPVEIMGNSLLARVVSIVDDKSSHLQSTDQRVVGVLVDNHVPRTKGVISTLELAEAVARGIRIAEIAGVYEDRDETDGPNKEVSSNVYHIDFAHHVKDDDNEFEELAS